MPQLRGDARRGRAQPNPIVQAERPSNTRRRRSAAARNAVTRSLERREEIELVEGGDEVGGEENEADEGVGERRMDDFNSGARSADKLPGAEDEGSTAPLPEKVR